MSKCNKKELVNLEALTGFNLRIVGADGGTLDEVGTYAVDRQCRSRLELILLSCARTLAYMFRFCIGNRAERKHYMAQLRDFHRKLGDFINQCE